MSLIPSSKSHESILVHLMLYLVSPILYVFLNTKFVNRLCNVTNTQLEPNIIRHFV